MPNQTRKDTSRTRYRLKVTSEEKQEMSRFLIEYSYSSEYEACSRAANTLLSTGSHYITHADWGCRDGVYKAWLIAEVDSKDDAMRIVPPAFRSDTKVIQLNKFTLQEIQNLVQKPSMEPEGFPEKSAKVELKSEIPVDI